MVLRVEFEENLRSRQFRECSQTRPLWHLLIIHMGLRLTISCYRVFSRWQSVTSRSREFPVPGILLLFGWYRYRYRKNLVPEKSTGIGTGKIWSRKKVPVPVPKKFGPGKKYRYRYRRKLVPEKSTGTGIGENWSRYRRIPGNSRSLYIFISSCTFRHWEKEMSL